VYLLIGLNVVYTISVIRQGKKCEEKCLTSFAHCLNKVNQMSKADKKHRNGTEYTGIKMERNLYAQARARAKSRHQTYSEYVRQLIVQDVEKREAVPA
jgi:hypothetical protein